MDTLETGHELPLDLLPVEPLLLVLLALDNDVAELVEPDGLSAVVLRRVVVIVRVGPVVRVAETKAVVVRVRVVLEGRRPVRGLGVPLCDPIGRKSVKRF
jgi:hypothetical protein